MTPEQDNLWVAALHGIEQCGKHAPNCAWLGCTDCCKVVAEEIQRLIREEVLRISEK